MLIDHYPLLGLRLTTLRLDLGLPTGDELSALADLAAEGVHDPAVMPFGIPWTDQEPVARARSVVTYQWARLGASTPDHWELNLVVRCDGEVVGTQGIAAKDFAVLREVNTGSWLGQRYHGRGIGTQMRAAVLHLAFAGLDAQYAISGAHEDNHASYAVSRKLGYQPDGIERRLVRGVPTVLRRLRLTRQAWEEHRGTPVEMHGLDACLPSLIG